MSIDVEDATTETASTLVSGILGDLQHLVEQQIELSRREIEVELFRRASAATVFVIGLGLFVLDAMIVCLTIVHLLHWMASAPGTDPAWLPLWACFGLVAAILIVIGGIVVSVGRARFESLVPRSNRSDE